MMMGPTNSRPAELALPVDSLAALRRALGETLGADGAAHALLAAGHAAGDAFFQALSRVHAHGMAPQAQHAASAALRELGEDAFWSRLSQLFADRGWGTLVLETVHPGIGELRSPDWVEADAAAGALRPACFFSAGLLANLLGQVAGNEVAILEVECRSQGDVHCRFLFGAAATLDEVHRRIEAGEDVASALAALA